MTLTPQLPPGWRNDTGAATALLAVLRAKHQETNPPPTWDTPGELAKALDPATTQTPALALIDAALVRVHRGESKRLIISMPPQEGKLIADDTPVATPSGWVRHGDLRVGDYVFHPSGNPVRVIEVHAPALASLRVTFSDHSALTVHPNHEWTVYDRSSATTRTVETKAMQRVRLGSGAPGRGHRYRFLLPNREALTLPNAKLLIDPYTLGVWLGDGSTKKPAITHHPADSYALAYSVSSTAIHNTTGIHTDYYAGEMIKDLRAAGVFGNKHIPPAYLRASESQRRALLAGLIDTDGHVGVAGQVSFDNANEQMVRDTAELIRTLGYRAHVHRPTPAKMSSSGIQGVQQMWRVTFTPHDQGPARLTRKKATALSRVRRRVAVIGIEEVPPVPGRCITVDSADGLYLAGENLTPTHNSERTTHYGALWMLHKNPDLRIGIVSYGDEIASGFSYKIRTDVMTYTGREGTANLNMILQRDSKAASRWQLQYPAKGGVYAIGIGGALTGRPIDALFIDDPVKDFRNADSTLLSEQAWQWWQSVARPRLHPNAPVVLILTRWHEADLAGRLLAKQAEDEAAGLEHFDQWEVINIPAVADHDPDAGEVDPLGREPGEFMLSARGRTLAQWRATQAATSPRIWSALYQGKPSPDAGDVWKRQWWRRYDSMLWSTTDGATFTVPCDEMIQSWDMTFKDTKSSDYVVGQVWARVGANAYLIDQVRARLSFTDTLAAFKTMTAKWPQATAKLVEDKANGTAVIDTLKSKIGGIIPITPHESKYARANAVSPFIESGNVHMPSAAVQLFEAESFIEEAAAFPNGAHDDQIDAASQALARLFIDGAGAAAWIAALRAKVAAEGQTVILAEELENLDPLAAARLAEFRDQYR